ncbi:MAG: glycosyltransferase family 2 protein [Clostridia bacterium]|nr:glycosyltransferase family 2 protein [Clostridia bacterium]
MKISAIIPAYNEENTISDVIKTIKSVNEIEEIIVVSDGSRDNTAGLAISCGARVVELEHNRGKGAAIKAGIKHCSGEIILLLDADLIGLNAFHIRKLLNPVLNNSADMTIGLFSKGRFSTDIAQKIAPNLSGQRAVRKSVLESLKGIDTAGYGIEVSLTIHAQKTNIRVDEVVLEDLTHVMKEEKLGLLRGFMERMKMYWQILKGMRLARR